MSTIAEWLGSLGLSEYEKHFAENHIDDVGILPHLTDQDLTGIGIPLGHRRKMLDAIAQLNAAAARSAPQPQLGPAPEPKPDTAERRQLTVMFCDLVGSTALSTKLDPEDLRSIINAYHRCCTELVERNGGFVAKYMGDGLLAYFGYPRASEYDAERAVQAGLALVETVPKLATNAGTPLQVRVGIATGLVVVGALVGAGAAQEQAVIGETPNLAARLQALAKPGAVVISASTRKLVGGLFECCDLGPVSLKGFAEDMRAWQVAGLGTVESRFEALRATTTPLVGRDEEIDLVMRRWDQAKGGNGKVVLISGEPGIGKSRLAQTVVERISGQPHARLRYFCSPHHEESALYPSIAQLERAAGFRREDTAEQKLAKLEAVLTQGTNALAEAFPLLADLLSLPTGDGYSALNLTPQKRKEKTLQALLSQVEGLASRRPVLMVFEDVHWSDPTTRLMLDLLIDRVPDLRVLVVITFRPEFAPPWNGRPHVTIRTLSRLPARQRTEMIAQVTGGKALPREIADQIADRTDGVPLFIEELTKHVLESGIVTDAGDRYAVAVSVGPLAIPTSLHASLLGRLDRLAPTREIAQIGATLGRSFSHALISAVAEMPRSQVDDALAQLVNAELVFRRGPPPDAEYTFKHALIQEVAYSTLLRSRRQQIHARVASVLDQQFPDIAAAQPNVLAHHCTEAGLLDKAAEHWLKAGRQSVGRSAMVEATAQLHKGLRSLSGLPESTRREQQELDLLIALGPAVIATKGYGAAEVNDIYERARAIAEKLDRIDCVVPLLCGHFYFHVIRAEFGYALSRADEIKTIGGKQNDRAIVLLGHYLRSQPLFCSGNFEGALFELEQCAAVCEPQYRAVIATMTAEDPYAAWPAMKALILGYLGRFDESRTCVKAALLAARQTEHVYTVAFVLIWACWSEWTSMSASEVRQYADEALDVSNQNGFMFWLAWALLYKGWSMTASGLAADALPLVSRGCSAHRATGAVLSTAHSLILLADAHGALNRAENGLSLLDEASQIASSCDDRYNEAELYRLRGDLLLAGGNQKVAEQAYHQAFTTAERQKAKSLELRAATSLSRLWRDQGKRAEAHDLLAPVYGWFTEGFDTPVLREAKALLDELGGSQSAISVISA